MSKYVLPAVIAATLLCSASCKKNKNGPTPGVDSTTVITYPDYMALKPGNYWVYQEYMTSDTGVVTLEGMDSVYVERDTTINGMSYHKYVRVPLGSSTTFMTVSFLRDSLAYTVSLSGHIVFSPTDFTTIFFSKTLYPNAAHVDTELVTEQMGFKDSIVATPAGTFTTETFRQIYHYHAPYNNFGDTRDIDNTYAKNVGLVSSTLYLYVATPTAYFMKLKRYHLN